ncbi:hypothetical protein SAMN05216223_101176 [Actinacidiphila yanglinensis]|uniref:Uncharacterized protein n=1 Tax=Actinacidiphila yanglinensis TaxID=310779 RepID=A0A1H5SKU1_9ACTN|nr:hypothetical protein [Actinacidiphila yanglinensis]SEF51206.1 hypothetical protein SAMN05216223_101176 [Actinacidiphila yanglinensis]
MTTSKVVLAAQRYEAAERARQAAADDLKAESAAALADNEQEEDVQEAIGRPLDEVKNL